ncbi:hypothetical protein E4U17_002557 [Claviceps sp. LM77 group G4]|nr:hypothetical protein E4U17_002557 [Claviceps sp. LM77 group G4]KAG6068030.1 hypothetical protein E4U16_008043 [Claviceps sp. LM84 group G4]
MLASLCNLVSEAICPDDEEKVSVQEPSSEYNSENGDSVPPAFPQFVRLPPELRHQIWCFYCPDLSAKPRVLTFQLGSRPTVLGRPDQYSVTNHSTLAYQTKTLRTMLATHRESRSIAVGKYPDELAMDVVGKLPDELTMDAGSGKAIVRFRKETDVISLMDFEMDRDYFLPDFSEKIENLGVRPMRDVITDDFVWNNDAVVEAIPAIKAMFPNLKRLLSHCPAVFGPRVLMDWGVTDQVHACIVEGNEPRNHLGEDTKTMYCWPDSDAHPSYTLSTAPRLCSLEKMDELGIEIWPIVEYIVHESEKTFAFMTNGFYPVSL